jgi:hypothetical protein
LYFPALRGEGRADVANSVIESMNDAQENQPEPEPAAPKLTRTTPKEPLRPRELGGRDAPEPTRYGDWEKAGRCIDF